MKFAIHQALTVTNGVYKGVVGTVTACIDAGTTVELKITGIHKGKPIDKVLSFGFSQVRAL